MKFDKKTVHTLRWLIVFAAIIWASIHNLSVVTQLLSSVIGIISPILMGLVLAFVLNIPLRLLEKHVIKPRGKKWLPLQKKLQRPLSMLVSLLLLLIVLAGLSMIVIPQLIDSLTRVFAMLPNWAELIRANLSKFSETMPEIGAWINSFHIDWATMQASVMDFVKRGLGSAVGSAASMATSAFGTAASFMLAFIMALGMLANKERLSCQLQGFVRAYLKPQTADKVIQITALTGQAFNGFISAQVLEACILGALCFVGMLLFRFPHAALISVFVAVGALIPFFGAFISGLFGGLLIASMNAVPQGIWFVVYFVVLQQLEGNLIYPRVMGSRVGLPALWVLVAVTVGSGAFGIVGMLVSVPVFAVAHTLLRESVHARRSAQQAAQASQQVAPTTDVARPLDKA
ncbi:MAG: AI-2E family transporter [Clostridia bacterium]